MIVLTGRRYGRLVVGKIAGRTRRGIRRPRSVILWHCICDCGKEVIVAGGDLCHSRTESCGCKRKKTDDNPAARQVWYSYNYRARKVGQKLSIPKEQFYRLILNPCFYCGVSGSNVSKNKYNGAALPYNGLDRIDNNKGYTLNNSVPCCEMCNKAKRDLTQQEFLVWIKKAYLHSYGGEIYGG